MSLLLLGSRNLLSRHYQHESPYQPAYLADFSQFRCSDRSVVHSKHHAGIGAISNFPVDPDAGRCRAGV